MIYIANGTEFLMHHGVKGQKWGVRRKQYAEKRYKRHLKLAREDNERAKRLEKMSLNRRIGKAILGVGAAGVANGVAKTVYRDVGRGAYHMMNGGRGTTKQQFAKVVGSGIIGAAAASPIHAASNAILKRNIKEASQLSSWYHTKRANKLKQKYNFK